MKHFLQIGLVPLLTLCLCPIVSQCFTRKIYPQLKKVNTLLENNDNLLQVAKTNALFLTPYIQQGKIQEGRILSQVKGLPGAAAGVESYSGFLTVNSKYNSNMFFWFFPALVRKHHAKALF